ncbi:hypothetical protein PI125_g10251 [Phytophthora idaei]|nr:hypothetical protein PI125_g10251 [Phytophthora idaei]
MANPHTWNLLCSGVFSEDATVLLQGMKKWKTVKSQLMSCTFCSSGAPHAMRYRLLRCVCNHCTDAVPYLHCAWRLKVQVCQEADTVDVHELGDHHSRARAPFNSCITPGQRDFIKELARENLMPMRIRHALGRKFGIRPAALPSLRTVQNVVNHFRRTRLSGNDKRKAIMVAVQASAFSGRESDHDAFTFTSAYGGFGVPEAFLTPPGYATTNPVEQFNRALKRDYTHHRQLKMGLLLACCGHHSMALPRFSRAYLSVDASDAYTRSSSPRPAE